MPQHEPRHEIQKYRDTPMRFRYIRPLAAGAAAAIIAAPDAMMADIYHRPPLKTWSTDHAVTPHLGQGANQTIEDAITLAVLLQDAQAADIPVRRRGRQWHIGVHGAYGRRRIQRRPQGTKDGYERVTHHRAVFRELPHPRRPDHRRTRHRAEDRAQDPRPHSSHGRRPGGRRGPGRPGRRGWLHQGPQAIRQVDIELPGRSNWPTWR